MQMLNNLRALRRPSVAGKSPEEIRKTFNIKNDFTPEEEEKIKGEGGAVVQHV